MGITPYGERGPKRVVMALWVVQRQDLCKLKENPFKLVRILKRRAHVIYMSIVGLDTEVNQLFIKNLIIWFLLKTKPSVD